MQMSYKQVTILGSYNHENIGELQPCQKSDNQLRDFPGLNATLLCLSHLHVQDGAVEHEAQAQGQWRWPQTPNVQYMSAAAIRLPKPEVGQRDGGTCVLRPGLSTHMYTVYT